MFSSPITTFPGWVYEQIGAGYVLVAKNMLDFDCKPDMKTAHEHVAWFHNFWWKSNAHTKPKLIAFYDSREEAIEAGVKFAMKPNGHMYNWAVYNCGGVLVDGKY
jgi:hypothetical protein